MEKAEVIEHFYGVYLLYCTNPKYKGKTYIGYTVDPRRRIKQHNAGKKHGGAWRTSNRGPWNMVLIVHGFPNSTSALRFEWAWQHPHVSRRLKHVAKKRRTQRVFDFYLSVLEEMLKVGPWCRLPLTIRWLDAQFFETYARNVSAPLHMPICHGKVISKKIKKPKTADSLNNSNESILFCSLCSQLLEKKECVTCVKPDCLLLAHSICLAELFCKNDKIVPVEGTCPACDTNILWGDLIRKKIGCSMNFQQNYSEASSSDDDT